MPQRYFLIEPQYSDPDTFCHFIVGSNQIHTSIQIYADLNMLNAVATALAAPSLEKESPEAVEDRGEDLFNFCLTVLPHTGEDRCLRFRVFQDWLDDGAPFRADIRFKLSKAEAEEFSRELRTWCAKPDNTFVWKD